MRGKIGMHGIVDAWNDRNAWYSGCNACDNNSSCFGIDYLQNRSNPFEPAHACSLLKIGLRDSVEGFETGFDFGHLVVGSLQEIEKDVMI